MTILVGQALTLRPPRESDVAERFALGNDAEIMRMFGVDPSTIPSLTLERARCWVEALATHPHAWIVEHRRRFLGEVRLD